MRLEYTRAARRNPAAAGWPASYPVAMLESLHQGQVAALRCKAILEAQMRLNTSVPLVPPKPKPFDIATSIFCSRATLGT